MKLMKKIRKLCTPAYVYLVISVIAIVGMMVQNAGHTNIFCLGEYECDVKNTAVVFMGQGIYTAFWVFILDCICKSGYKNISWFLVLIPYILMFIVLGMFVLRNRKEGFREGKKNRHKSSIYTKSMDGKCMKFCPKSGDDDDGNGDDDDDDGDKSPF